MIKKSPKAPFTSVLIDKVGNLSKEWQQFFQLILSAIQYLGEEQSFALVNNQGVAANITALKFDYAYTSQATIDYLIQRVTSGTSKIQSGVKHCTYNPDTNSWSIFEYGTPGPDASGITFSITSLGQVQYTSSNLAGTEEISRIVFRVREIRAKHSTYSKVG